MGRYATLVQLIADATAAGKALLLAANAAAQRTLLGLGTSAVRDEGYFAVADTHGHTVINLDGTSIVDTDGNGNVRITTAVTKGIVLAPLNDTVSVIRGTAQPQTFQIANTWSASDDFELLRFSANTTEYRITSIPGAASGNNLPIKIGHTVGAGTFTAAVTVNTDSTVLLEDTTVAGNITLRNGATPTRIELAHFYTNADEFEAMRIEAAVSQFRIGSIAGELDGATQDIAIGYWDPLTDNFVSVWETVSNANVVCSGTITADNFSGSSSGTNTGDQDLSGYVTTAGFAESVDDRVAALLVAGTNITLTYNDGAGTITISAAGGGGSGDALTSDPLSQFAETTSAQLEGVISDNTGTGLAVFNDGADMTDMSVDMITVTETLGAEMVVDGGFAAPTQYTCATSGVNTTTDTFTLSSDPGWAVDDIVQYHNGGGTTATGLVHLGCYFVHSYSAGVMTVKTTLAGGAVNVTGTGNNAQFFAKLNWFSGTSGVTGGVAGWDLTGGRAAKQLTGTHTLRPAVALAPTPGQLYKIQYTVSNWTGAGTTLVFGGVTAQASTAPNANGTYTRYVTALTSGDLSFVPVTGMRADIDDVSIRPVLSGVATGAIPYALTATMSDPTANEVAYCFTYTTNKSTMGSDTGLQICMNDVSSPGTSLPFQIVTGASSVFSVQSNGTVVAAGSLTCTQITASQTISTGSVISTSYAGAANIACLRTSGAILTGGTGTTNFPQFLQQPTAATGVTTWSTAGTWWGVNTATGFAGNFIDFHVNGGASVFTVDYTGKVVAAGGLFTTIASVEQRCLVHAPTWNSYSPAGAGTATLLLSSTGSNIHRVIRPTTGDITIAFSGDEANQTFLLVLETSGSGTPGTVTWPSGITWLTNAGVAPTISTANNKTDSVMFLRTGAGAYLAWHTGQN